MNQDPILRNFFKTQQIIFPCFFLLLSQVNMINDFSESNFFFKMEKKSFIGSATGLV